MDKSFIKSSIFECIFIVDTCFSDKSDLEQKEANFYGSAWWTSNVDRVRSHLAHREIEVIKLI